MRKFKISDAFLITIAFYLTLQVLSLSALISLLVDFEENPDLFYWSIYVPRLISSIILLALVLLYLTKSKFLILDNNPKFHIGWILLTLFSGLFIVFIQEPLDYLLGFYEFEKSELNVLEFEFYRLPHIISAVLLTPIIEELIFRKMIFRNLIDSTYPIVAYCLSALLFSMIHVPDFYQVFITFIGGLLAAFLYYKTSYNILYPILFHIVWNATANFMNYFQSLNLLN